MSAHHVLQVDRLPAQTQFLVEDEFSDIVLPDLRGTARPSLICGNVAAERAKALGKYQIYNQMQAGF